MDIGLTYGTILRTTILNEESGMRNEELLRKPNAEPSSLELSRVATEEDEVKVKPAIDEVN